ncbi:caspase domain-containing protein [Candidatus Poribacteria bacterium]
MLRIGYILAAILCVSLCSYASAQVTEDKGIVPLPTNGRSALSLSPHKKWGLIIGISNYDAPDIRDLSYADDDARALYNLLVDPKCGGFSKSNVFLLTSDTDSVDQKPTRANILFYLDLLAQKAKPEDTVIIMYSGHGTEERKEETGRKYLLPMEASLRIVEAYAIDNQDFVEKINRIDARKVLVFLDCCHAGGISQSGKESSGPRLSDDYYKVLGEAEGVITFASCRGDQESFESPEDGHGIFTKYLLEALRGAADSDHNGAATFKEIWEYVPGKVREWSMLHKGKDRLQEPVFHATSVTNLDILISKCTIPGKLKLNVYPTQYRAKIDGISVDPTIIDHDLEPGLHKIDINARGYKKWQETVSIVSNQFLRKDVRLNPRSRLGAVLKSTAFPGWGDWPDRKAAGVLMVVIQVGTAAGAALYHLDYENKLEEYRDARQEYGNMAKFSSYSEYKNQRELMLSKHEDAENSRTLRNILFVSAVAGVRVLGALESAVFMPRAEGGDVMLAWDRRF